VSRGDVALTVEFERLNAARVSADEVRAAYEQLEEWLATATGDAANMRDAILETARRNAEAAPAIVAAGGLEGNAREEESNTNAGESQQRASDQAVVTEQVVEQATEQDEGTGTAAEDTDNQNAPAGDDSGNAGDNAGGDSGGNPSGNAQPEPTPAPEPDSALDPEFSISASSVTSAPA